MEWWLALLIILGSLMFLMLTGMPVAFCFILVNIIWVLVFWGGVGGLDQLIRSLRSSVSTFMLLPLPLFILMGELMFHSGIGTLMLDTLDKWLGRIPGRLSLLAVAGGAVLSSLTGASMGSVALLGDVLMPEMERRGYKKPMTMGPILGSGGLAIMIPPSGVAVLVGAIGEISIGKLLIAIIIPGILMAILYATYITSRCRLQPSIAPPYKVVPTPLSRKLIDTMRYILPLGLIIFLVIGVIFLGIATPTEAAATGTLGTFVLVAIYKKLNWDVVKKAVSGAIAVTIMMFLIMAGAKAFSQILAYSGASTGVVELVIGLPLAPIGIFIGMQVILLFMGTFMNILPILMITFPLFIPVIRALGFNPVWFGVVSILNMEMAITSPPFGTCLFVMKGVAPPDTTMGDVYRAALPFLGCDLVAMIMIIAFPGVALWLPGLMS